MFSSYLFIYLFIFILFFIFYFFLKQCMTDQHAFTPEVPADKLKVADILFLDRKSVV